MSTLLISSVDGIEVIQVGESKLSVTNKSQDAGTVGAPKVSKKTTFSGIGFSKSPAKKVARSPGQNKTVDLGKGKQTLSIKIFVSDRADNDALFDILHKQRFCKITDKFKGTIRVYINSVTVIDSDKHVDRTIFEIKASIEDLDRPADTDYTTLASGLADDLKETKIRDSIDSLSKLSPSSPTLERVEAGLSAIVSPDSRDTQSWAEKKAGVSVHDIKTRVNDVVTFPDDLVKLATKISDIPEFSDSKPDESAKPSTAVAKMPIFSSTVRGEPVSNFNEIELSQIEISELIIENIVSELLNQVKLLKDIHLALGGGFATRESFDEGVDQILQRLISAGYSSSEIADFTYIIKSFANTQDYPTTIVVNIAVPRPLVRIVYDRYGSLDSYSRIEALNSFKDNDSVSGAVRVFA